MLIDAQALQSCGSYARTLADDAEEQVLSADEPLAHALSFVAGVPKDHLGFLGQLVKTHRFSWFSVDLT